MQNTNELSIKNCIIEENSASETGGGIYFYGIDSKNYSDIPCLHISNCSISENSAGESGGGIYTYLRTAIYLSGENKITKNTAVKDGAGIYYYLYTNSQWIAPEENKKLFLWNGGKLYIQGNTLEDSTSSNLCLISSNTSSKVIPIRVIEDDPLVDGSSIGLSVDTTATHNIEHIATNYSSYAKYYTSDDPSKHITVNDGNMDFSDGENEAYIIDFCLPNQISHTIDKQNYTINIVMPYDADLTHITPSSVIIPNGVSISPGTGTVCDYSSPVYYTVTKGNTSQSWTVNVTRENAPDDYSVTVNNGSITSSANENGKYYIGSIVTIKADTLDGKVFKGWKAEGVTLKDSTMSENGFLMPENDVTLTAEYDTLVSTIDITVDSPIDGESLPEKASVKAEDTVLAEFDISWQTDDTTAKYGTNYTSVVTIPKQEGYVFTDSIKATVNGNVADYVLNSDGSITIYGSVAAKSKLVYIMHPSDISVPYNTDVSNLPLPSSVGIGIETGDFLAADVTWNTSNYSPTTSGEQELSGTVTLPETVDDGGLELSTRIYINVGKEGDVAVPTISPAPGYYTEKLTLELTAEEGAKIYYTTDSTKPTTSSTEYTDYIPLNGISGTTLVTIVKAIAVKDDVISDVASFEYAISLNTFDVNVVGGTGSGAYKVGDTVTIKSEIRDGMVFDGWVSDDVEITADRKD
ncbi:MAG: chitobiase/beta-hexosaminidase C-terminal domain-containing protein, partial [Lachnospirales bacterium]